MRRLSMASHRASLRPRPAVIAERGSTGGGIRRPHLQHQLAGPAPEPTLAILHQVGARVMVLPDPRMPPNISLASPKAPSQNLAGRPEGRSPPHTSTHPSGEGTTPATPQSPLPRNGDTGGSAPPWSWNSTQPSPLGERMCWSGHKTHKAHLALPQASSPATPRHLTNTFLLSLLDGPICIRNASTLGTDPE